MGDLLNPFNQEATHSTRSKNHKCTDDSRQYCEQQASQLRKHREVVHTIKHCAHNV